MPESFKDWFNAARYREIARQLKSACVEFDSRLFLKLTCDKISERALMDRLRQTSVAAAAALPGDYQQKLTVVRQIAGPGENGFVGIWYADFVGQFGLDVPELSLPALAEFTRFGSAEFAIREFILRNPQDTMNVMLGWSRDSDEHVRRLASEGSRPRLPWGKRLQFLVADPAPTRAILENLRDDPSLYVRKSVANHLNDISKNHPEYVLDLISGWDRSSERTAWICRHGLRTLIKQAHPRALNFLGVGQKPALDSIVFTVSRPQIKLGESQQFSLQLRSGAKVPQSLMVDYVVHYAKASGRTHPKVFKWKQLGLAAGESLSLSKKQTFRDFTTRRHYPGEHRVDIQINGQCVATAQFVLRIT